MPVLARGARVALGATKKAVAVAVLRFSPLLSAFICDRLLLFAVAVAVSQPVAVHIGSAEGSRPAYCADCLIDEASAPVAGCVYEDSTPAMNVIVVPMSTYHGHAMPVSGASVGASEGIHALSCFEKTTRPMQKMPIDM